MTSFYFITITKYPFSINELYISCSWFSWTFTNSNIKQVVLHVKNSFEWTKQNNSKNKNKLSIIILNKIITKNKHKLSKNKHKLNIVISEIKSSKISINKQNYKNNYLYLTLGCKGLGLQDIPQDHNIKLLYISIISWQSEYKIRFITIVLKSCTITQKHRLHIELLITHLFNILMVKIVLCSY